MTSRAPTDEERAEFKRGELQAVRDLMCNHDLDYDLETLAVHVESFMDPMGTEEPSYLRGKQAGLKLAAALIRDRISSSSATETPFANPYAGHDGSDEPVSGMGLTSATQDGLSLELAFVAGWHFARNNPDFDDDQMSSMAKDYAAPLTSATETQDGHGDGADCTNACHDPECILVHGHFPGSDHTDGVNTWQFVRLATETQDGERPAVLDATAFAAMLHDARIGCNSVGNCTAYHLPDGHSLRAAFIGAATPTPSTTGTARGRTQ